MYTYLTVLYYTYYVEYIKGYIKPQQKRPRSKTEIFWNSFPILITHKDNVFFQIILNKNCGQIEENHAFK